MKAVETDFNVEKVCPWKLYSQECHYYIICLGQTHLEPSKRPHLDPDLSPEPSIAENLLVPTTMSDHSICIECGIMGDPRCEKTTFRSLCIAMNYSPVDEVCHAFTQANQVPF